MIPASENVTLLVIAHDGQGTGLENTGWEHASVHARYRSKSGKVLTRIPNWSEMCFVKNSFWEEDEAVMQLHPPESEWIDNHPHVLHLWRPIEDRIPLPPGVLVGLKRAD
jgi:hypothetical protein